MANSLTVLERQSPEKLRNDFRQDVLHGLSANPKRIPSRHFYDAVGSRIFQEIMDMPEYYLTDCEREILQKHSPEIVAAVDRPFRMIELGAGDGRKTRILLEELQKQGRDFEYTPLDISESAVVGLLEDVSADYPKIPMRGLVCEYNHGLEYLCHADRRNLVLFLGSSIGNFSLDEASAFFGRLRAMLNPGDLCLVGFDLVKDPAVLQRAYDDAAGITRRFNLNLLSRINNELGGHFDLDGFQHYASYDAGRSTMESYLLSRRRQSVRIEALGHDFDFGAWEAVHVEFSWKYSEGDIAMLAERNNFRLKRVYTDDRDYFAVSLFEAV